MKIDKDNEVFLNLVESEIKIKLIINPIGVCDNGKLCSDVLDNKEHILKKCSNFVHGILIFHYLQKLKC